LNIGKFPPTLLERLLAKAAINDPRVIMGPKVGEDAAIIDMGERLLVAKSDPITFATDLIGWYAVQVNANDVACAGGTPKWFLATLLVPESFLEAQAEAVFDQVLEACNALNIALIGGHSEVTYGINRPIILGSMLGEVERDRLVHTGGAQEGDSIVLTKGIAIEGTALLSRDCADALKRAGVDQKTIRQAATFLSNSGISVVKDAGIACNAVRVHSLHDPTEGGLIIGLREVARASGLGLAVEEGSIPVLPECQAICQALGLDPLGLLASGALLITLPSGDVPTLLAALEQGGISGWEIGQMIASEEGFLMIGYEGEVPLPEFPRDELARYFSAAQSRKTKDE
jgi:hydrogenase expression/formation protein HypE